MNDKTPGLPFYQMAAAETLHDSGILSLLLHFKWTWIGLIAIDGDDGERFVQSVLPLYSQHGICFALVERILTKGLDEIFQQGAQIHDRVMKSTTNVLVLYGNYNSMFFLIYLKYIEPYEPIKPKGKVWITTGQTGLNDDIDQRTWELELIHGALSFTPHSKDVPGFFESFEKNPPITTADIPQEYWFAVFQCVGPNSTLINEYRTCTGEEKVEDVPQKESDLRLSGQSYNVYNAVYAVAHALQAMSSAQLRHRRTVQKGGLNQFWQVMESI